MTGRESTRRTHLQRVGSAVTALALAGCSAGEDAATTSAERSSATETGTATPATARTTTATPAIHPGYDYETTEVRVLAPGGDLRGSVTAAIADTPDLRYTGLSDTDSLPEDRGMLFVYEREQSLTYVMRRMSFGIDIVYINEDRLINEIHHAPEPGPDEDGNEQEYPGRGQYVLEVNLDWTTRNGVEEGDRVEFSL